MLLTIEKVSYLKAVDIFAQTPDYLLAAIAHITEEIELEPGQTFIEEGALDDSLYIIIDGEVRVHSQDQTIAIFGPRDSVGELALLDPEPRSASVTTLDDALLFRIAKEPFDEVMASRPEIAQGVIRVLCRRLRNRTQSLAVHDEPATGAGDRAQQGVA